MVETLIAELLRTIEREVGPISALARVEIIKGVWNVIDQAEQLRIDPWGDD